MADDHLHKQTPGWLLPYLVQLDVLDAPEHDYHGHGRWDYWLDACARGSVPEGDIPPLTFTPWPNRDDAKHVKDVLQVYVNKGYWYNDAWLSLVKWLLHGFGRAGLEKEVEQIPSDVRNVWYELFNLGYLLREPVDWSAVVFSGRLPGVRSRSLPYQGAGFFITPPAVSQMMAAMVFAGEDPDDSKLATVCDPCCGTGSMLMAASNFSLRLFGVDIVRDLCLCAELNGWLWMPWLVHTPPHMRRLFARLKGEDRPPPPIPVRLETEPAKVEAVIAYRKQQMGQADFFELMGAS